MGLTRTEVIVGRALTVDRALRKIQSMVADGFDEAFSAEALLIQRVLRAYESEEEK